jgi:ABC-2 type transport system permease protein
MKSFAGEKSQDTEQLLYVSPKRTLSIVLGKIFSIASIIGISLIISIVYYLILSAYGTPDFGRIIVAWIGFMLLSIAYISFGILMSSVTGNQIVSAIITLVFLMLPLVFSVNNEVLSYIFLIDYYQKFASGVISLKEIVCLVSFSIMCVSLTTIGIEKRRN